jgi:hypothetical protein
MPVKRLFANGVDFFTAKIKKRAACIIPIDRLVLSMHKESVRNTETTHMPPLNAAPNRTPIPIASLEAEILQLLKDVDAAFLRHWNGDPMLPTTVAKLYGYEALPLADRIRAAIAKATTGDR